MKGVDTSKNRIRSSKCRPWARGDMLSPLGIFANHVLKLGYSLQKQLQLVLKNDLYGFFGQGSKIY